MSQKLKDKVRSEAGECIFCGISNDAHKTEFGEQLHVHRIVPARAGGEYERGNVVVVCTTCHDTIERTQAQALKRLVEMKNTDELRQEKEQLRNQRDALLERVEALERAIRSPSFYADIVRDPRARGEVVTKKMGSKHLVTNDHEAAVDAYREWGDALRRFTLSASSESVVKSAEQSLESGYRLEDAISGTGGGK